MVKLTLYYPDFVEIDGSPESIDFETLSDLKKNKTVKGRLCPNGKLEQLFSYENNEPEQSFGQEVYYRKVLFLKLSRKYWGACIVSSEVKSEVEQALKTLNVKPAKW